MSGKGKGKKRSKRKLIFKLILVFAALALLALDAYLLDRHIKIQKSKIIHEATIECGDDISLDLFFTEVFPKTHFVTDVDAIDTTVPASYELTIRIWKFDEKVVLNIVDTTPPTGVAVPQYTYTEWLPPAEDCITDAYDMHGVSIEYYDEEPDISTGGETLVPVKLTDNYGNFTIVHVPFYLTDDHTAPVISGTHDLEYYIGDPISYRDGVTVSDDYDDSPELSIDTSNVVLDEDGTYPIYYTATDEYGNTNTVTAYITLTTKPEGYVREEEIYAMAQEVLDEITTDDMSDVEKAMKIFWWARNYIHYVGDSIKTHWTAGANEGFTTLRGDCYTYYACCRALLDVAGIPNLTVHRNPAYNSQHFWNLVYLDGAWYHCDATPSSSHDGYWFMRTDDELDGSHRFDPVADELPDRATESVQRYLNFYNFTYTPPEDET